MAEGDTIHRVARRIGGALGGRPVAVESPGPRRPAGLAPARLDGAVLERVESRGKHLLLHFEGGLALHSHLGMRGAWHLYGRDEGWRKPRRAAWLTLAAGDVEAVNFNGTTMRLVRESELARDPRLSRLGPDVLGDGFEAGAGASALRGAAPDRELGDALLDQTVLAGIGNIFKSEACFAAGVDPWRRLCDLGDDELRRVAGAASDLMRTATISGRRPESVYRRAPRPCGRCRTPIRSRPQGQDARVTYWCPVCQG